MRAAGRLATRTLGDAVSHVEQVHRAVAARAFAVTAPVSLPARLLHDSIAGSVYAVVRAGGRATGMTVSEIVPRAVRSRRPSGSTARGNLALAALNAALGDELAAHANPLAIPMAVRVARSDVELRPDVLGSAFPEATPKLAVFVHGLGETEESWRLHAGDHGAGTESTYGARLQRDLGYTPVYLRYNTGRHVSENGRLLAALLEDLVEAWTVPIEEMVLVGHSMGGLVARSACHYAQESGDGWVLRLRHAFYLGTPHNGAGLEQWVDRLTRLLGKLDEGRPLASVLDRRSAGIKDLYAGYLLDDDWRTEGSGSNRQRREVPLVPWVNHYAISATVTTSRRHPVGRFVGDLLVQPASAHGRSCQGVHVAFPVGHTRHFGGLHHFGLLNHPSIYETMRDWLASPP